MMTKFPISYRLFTLFLMLCLCFACRNERSAQQMPTELNAYVYAYTSGTISAAAPIRIKFTQSVVDADQVGQSVDESLIDFDPNISGTFTWEDDRTILVQPDDKLTANTTYLAKVGVGKLFDDLPKSASLFEFNFRTRELQLNVSPGDLKSVSDTDLSKQQYTGVVTSSDVVNVDDVEKALTVSFDNQELPIEWSHNSDQMTHRFTVKGIKRTNSAKALSIKLNGQPVLMEDDQPLSVEIPSINDFKVLNTKVVQDKEQYISITFSDPLLKKQDVKGLVTIDNYKGDLKFLIEGNQLMVYPSKRINGNHRVGIRSGIKNIKGTKMQDNSLIDVTFVEEKPKLRIVGNGVIIPQSNGLVFPFEAINLKAVDVEIFKIYDDNILQFLQTNAIDGNYEMERVGEIVSQKKVDLVSARRVGTGAVGWTRHALDLTDMIGADKKAIYQIRLGFKPGYSNYSCGSDNTQSSNNMTVMSSSNDDAEDFVSILNVGYYGPDGYYDGYRYNHREDPCYAAYYNRDKIVMRNVFASNLGIIAKSGDKGNMLVAVTDLKTTEPLAGTKLTFYNYAQQMIGEQTTDGDGIARIELKKQPFIVVAEKGDQSGYLRLMDGGSLSLSRFDTEGNKAQKGLKGFIYGERGVWRPGDSLHLNFILEDKANQLPGNHPITYEIYDARNQLYQTTTTSENINRMYAMNVATDPADQTGNWRAVVKVGGATFSKTLKVETVKPNRLKIETDLDDAPLSVGGNTTANLQVNWLHGAPASNLKTKVEMQLKSVNTTFPKFKDYEFDDPARTFNPQSKMIYDKSVDQNGKASFSLKLGENKKNMPGKMKASFRIRAFEKGGDFSEDNFTTTFDPFESYAGIAIPKNKYGSKRIEMNREQDVSVALVDKDGKPLANRKLNVGLYRVNWRWWWDRGNNNVGNYNSSKHVNSMYKTIATTNGKGVAAIPVEVTDWGRYMIRVCDETTGHCSGDFFYAGYPWNNGGMDQQQREAAAMLVFAADKDKYETNETVEITIPSSQVARALITIENGSGVISSYWKDCKQGETKFQFETTPEMAPTVYAHVTLLQPHAQVENDMPIRMYGVIPINVEDPQTRLSPELKMAKVLEPEQKVNIKVSEADGKPMAYTIAMVDDGLLDLTRFKTPSPWNKFYAREGLGVKTWDLYDQVLGAYSGNMDRLLSIGGDDELKKPDGGNKANRFEPVVRHIGPFYLKKGETASHTIELPNYIGSVRTMVVAANNGAYGSAELTTPVRKPLMVLATLPRVLGPGEQLVLPVNVFAMEDKVKNVTVTVEESSGLIDWAGTTQKQIDFSRPGDEVVEFNINVRDVTGIAKFKVTVEGGGEKATQEIEIDVRNPNPYAIDIAAELIERGNNWTHTINPLGVKGTNTATLEFSSIPSMNLEKRLDYLIRYPHGCIEQTTSGAFPQLYVGRMMDLDEQYKSRIETNIKAAINRIGKFQNSTGGFSYWPGNTGASHWGTNYAGHFLLEAKQLGYNVPDNLLNNWKSYQKRVANNWNPELEDADRYSYRSYSLTQAYRLYTLALSGSPELGAMNRLRETADLPNISKFRLAAAYALAGQDDVANQLVKGTDPNIPDYQELGYSYGSTLRDQAMVLETFNILKQRKDAGEMAKIIFDRMGYDRWYSTQTTAYCLMALGKFIGDGVTSKGLKVAYTIGDNKTVNASSDKPVMLVEVPIEKITNRTVQINNTSDGVVYVRVITKGQPVVGDQSETSNHLGMSINYKTIEGKKLDPANIPQGTDFVAEVTIKNPGTKLNWYNEMSLDQVFPSGWEILNSRMSGVQAFKDTAVPEYRDIRDDRVYSYFDIGSSRTKTFRVQLNAAYKGRYYMPSVNCYAMYDETINARRAGQWVEVSTAEEL